MEVHCFDRIDKSSCWVRVHQRRIGGVKMKKEIRKHSHAGKVLKKKSCFEMVVF